MTTEEKLDRVVDNLANLSAVVNNLSAVVNNLSAVVNTLASSVVAHDNQIGALLQIAEKHEQAIANLEKQWQAYIRTLPRQ